MKIETRRDLHAFLENKLNRTYTDTKETRELGENLLKTYLVESNIPLTSLRDVDGFKIKLEKTKDETLYKFSVQKDGKPHSLYFADISDPRLWTLHTTSKSEKTDQFINKFVLSTMNHLDFPWLHTQFLENLVKDNIFRGFNLKFEEKVSEEEEIPVESLSMRLWGESAPRILEALRKDANLKNSTALSGVGLKHIFDSYDEFIVEDLTYHAKFTARGTTLDGHLFMVRKIVGEYEKILKEIEERSIKFTEYEQGYKIQGEPVTIVFEKKVEDVEKFLDEILSSTKPFRIWGMKREVDKKYFKAVCVDLHNNNKLDIEVTPRWMRVYLSHGSCGNTVLRLLTNIQHYFDSGARLVFGE